MESKLFNLPYLKETRQHLRRNLIEAELVLWEALKDKKLKGRKFRRQHSIGYYIADFYCPSEKLVIELDGRHHFTKDGIENDKMRDSHLSQLQIKVLRFENQDVLNNLTDVLKHIKDNFLQNE